MTRRYRHESLLGFFEYDSKWFGQGGPLEQNYKTKHQKSKTGYLKCGKIISYLNVVLNFVVPQF